MLGSDIEDASKLVTCLHDTSKHVEGCSGRTKGNSTVNLIENRQENGFTLCE